MSSTKLLASLLFIASALSNTAAFADGVTFLPGLKPGFKAEPTLAVTAGVMNAAAASDDAVGVYGLDFNMNCGLIQIGDNRVRTHLQLNRVDQSGVKATTVELSPRYTLPLGGGFSFGVGPALAWVQADTAAGKNDLFGYGMASGMAYRKGHYFSGIDLRYLNTEERGRVELENWLLSVKLGVNF